jgi:sialate O-acetylesterase
MVLQQGKETKIYGTGKPNEKIEIIFQNKTYKTAVNKKGFWLIKFAKLKVSKSNNSLIVKSTSNQITLHNILIGDIWLAGGQSNMQLTMERTKYMFPDEVEKANNPNIRIFTIPENYNFQTEQNDFDNNLQKNVKWLDIQPQTIKQISAVSYFFAKELNCKFNIPIGIIVCAIGGTPIAAWLPKKAILDMPALKKEAEHYKNPDAIKTIIKSESAAELEYYHQLNSSDKGLKQTWYKLTYNDSKWHKRNLTQPFNKSLAKTGSIWFRKTIIIPQKLQNKEAYLFLGTIIDEDYVYFNGKLIGTTSYRYPPRNYKIRFSKTGKCVITIRLINHYGLAEFTPGKPYFLSTDNQAFCLDGKWKYKRGTILPPKPKQTFLTYMATSLYNGMFSPLANFNIKGIIFYQGESDAISPNNYYKKFTRLIYSWREKLNKTAQQLPFIYVQLPYQIYTYNENWNSIRDQQTKALEIENTGMILSQDIGEYNDLHPQNKYLIAYRLSRLARKLAYNETIQLTPFEYSNTFKAEN